MKREVLLKAVRASGLSSTFDDGAADVPAAAPESAAFFFLDPFFWALFFAFGAAASRTARIFPAT